jgi:hypothetical protein
MPYKTPDFSDDTRKMIKGMFGLQYALPRIALAIGCTEKGLTKWLKKSENRDFWEECKQAREIGNIQVRQAFFNQAVNGAAGVAAKWLELFDDDFQMALKKSKAEIPNGEDDLEKKSEKELDDIILGAIKDGTVKFPMIEDQTALRGIDG